jgi:hypothetical protein
MKSGETKPSGYKEKELLGLVRILNFPYSSKWNELGNLIIMDNDRSRTDEGNKKPIVEFSSDRICSS